MIYIVTVAQEEEYRNYVKSLYAKYKPGKWPLLNCLILFEDLFRIYFLTKFSIFPT